MMDLKHAKDVEQRFRFLLTDFGLNAKDKKQSYLAAEDKTEFNKMKEKCWFLVENKDLMEESLLRVEKENEIYEEIAEVASQFKLVKMAQSNCLAISEDNTEILKELEDSIKENVKILNRNLEGLGKRLDILKK